MSSNFNKVIKLYIITFIFILMVSNVKSSDIGVTKGINPGQICPGTTSLITDVVLNKGSNELQFSVINTGSSSGFTTTVPPGFVLKPGQSKTIYTYISPRTTTEVGTYSLELSIQSNSESETISHAIDVKDCRSFEVVLVDKLKSVCPTDVEKYDFKLSNTGQTTETYDLSAEGQIASWITLSETTITLAKGDQKEIFAYVTTPSDSLGDYGFNLLATSRSNKKVKSALASLKVNPCFDYSLSTKRDFVSLCEHSQEIISVDITNKGTVSNNYNMEIEAPEWVSLENNKFLIEKGQTKSANIILTPDYNIQGDFKILFKATTEKGKIESKNEFSVNVKRCHGVDIKIEKNQDRICNSLSNSYNVLVKNTGDFNKDYKLELIGPVWSSLDGDKINLNPGEEKKLLLTINPNFDTIPGDYDIILRATALDSSKVVAENKLTVTTISKEECYRPSIGLKENQIEVSYDSTATIPIIIENKGNQQATYDIAISGTANNFVHLNPAVVTIDSNKADIVYLYLAPNIETANGDYSATVSVRLKDSTILASDTIQIKVSQSKAPIEVSQQPTAQKKTVWQRIKEFFSGKPEQPQIPITEITPEENISEDILTEITQPSNITIANKTLPEIENQTGMVTGQVPSEVISTPQSRNIDFDKANKQIVNQEKNQNVEFDINNESHSAKVTDISNNSVTIIIKSEPQFANLKIGESKDFDTNNDGVNDLRVTLMAIDNGKAKLVYENLLIKTTPTTENQTQELDENVIIENITVPIEENEQEKTDETKKPSFLRIYLKYIIAGIVILILLILIIKYRKGIKEFFEEEIEEEPVRREPIKPVSDQKKETPKEHPPAKKEPYKEEKKEEKKPVKKKKEVSEEEYY